jgi:hypothetical protein
MGVDDLSKNNWQEGKGVYFTPVETASAELKLRLGLWAGRGKSFLRAWLF